MASRKTKIAEMNAGKPPEKKPVCVMDEFIEYLINRHPLLRERSLL